MDDRKLLELARKAGGIDLTNQIAGGITVWIGTGTPEFLERFANLVAAAERERCTLAVAKRWHEDPCYLHDLTDAIRALENE